MCVQEMWLEGVCKKVAPTVFGYKAVQPRVTWGSCPVAPLHVVLRMRQFTPHGRPGQVESTLSPPSLLPTSCPVECVEVFEMRLGYTPQSSIKCTYVASGVLRCVPVNPTGLIALVASMTSVAAQVNTPQSKLFLCEGKFCVSETAIVVKGRIDGGGVFIKELGKVPVITDKEAAELYRNMFIIMTFCRKAGSNTW